MSQPPNFDKIINQIIEELRQREDKSRLILKLTPLELKEVSLLLDKLRK